MELVSVIIPTYNSEKFITEAIDSVIAQRYPNIEIIVVDDGSQDNTVELTRTKLRKEFRGTWQIIELQSNRGPSVARNIGLRAAHGSWIQFLDSDDRLAPTKFEREMAVCRGAPPDLAAVYSPWGRGFVDGGQIEWEGSLITPNVEGKASIMCLASACRPLHSAGLARREVLNQIGGFDESLRFWECEEINFRIGQVGQFKLVPSDEPQYLWRLHRGQIYIGGPGARYRSTEVALGWIRLVLKATGNHPIDQMKLPAQDQKHLLNECTLWGRLLYSQDREAFNRYLIMARTLVPQFRPTYPLYISFLSRYVKYETAEAIARIARAPKNFVRKALCKLKFRQPRAIFDWD